MRLVTGMIEIVFDMVFTVLGFIGFWVGTILVLLAALLLILYFTMHK